MDDTGRMRDALASGAADAATWRAYADLGESARREVALALKARVDELVRSEPPAAVQVAEALVRATDALPELAALALRGRAVAKHFNQDHAGAAEDLRAAVALYTESGEELEAARARRSLVDVLHMAGRSLEALEEARLARPVLEAAGETRLVAQLEVNLGNVYTRLDEYPDARAHYLAGRVAFEALGDAVGLAITDFNLAVVEMNANRVDEARSAWQSARSAFEEAGLELHVADCDYSLAYLESRQGRFLSAIEGLERARAAYGENGKPSGPPLCDMDLAEIHLRLDAWRDAFTLAERAATRFGELGMEYEQAKSEAFMGLARARLGDTQTAAADMGRAADRFRGLGNEVSALILEIQRAAVEADSLKSTGADGDNSEAALGRLARARTELAQRDLVVLSDLADVVLARHHLARAEPTAAAELMENLVARHQEGRVLDSILLSEALRLMAASQCDRGQVPEAIESLREAARHIETTYAQVPGSDVRLAFFRDRHETFVDLAWFLSEPESNGTALEALTVLEQSRSRSLAEGAAAEVTASDEFRRARQQLDWLLARSLDADLGASAGGDHDLRLSRPDDAELRAAQHELARLMPSDRTLRSSSPGFRPEDLADAAGESDLLLIYMASERGIKVFVVDGGEVEVVRLDATTNEIKRLRGRLGLQMDKLRLGPDYVGRHLGRLQETAHGILAELGRALLGPVAERAGGADRAGGLGGAGGLGSLEGRELVIVPYGALHDLPFHAFRLNDRPLIASCEVGYGLSTGLLAACRRRPSHPEGPLLIAGEAAGGLPAVGAELEHLQELYGNRVQRIAPEDLPGRLHTDAPTGGILHIAAHGLYQPMNPAFSAVCLGSKFLLAHDLLRMKLDLDLVTLSGCETGRKRRVGGEELFGLPRALLGAGARAMLGSLWAVDDRDAGSFMSAFYEFLAAGHTARRAVALAQRGLLEDRPHPFSWASFALVGAPDVRLPSRSPVMS